MEYYWNTKEHDELIKKEVDFLSNLFKLKDMDKSLLKSGIECLVTTAICGQLDISRNQKQES